MLNIQANITFGCKLLWITAIYYLHEESSRQMALNTNRYFKSKWQNMHFFTVIIQTVSFVNYRYKHMYKVLLITNTNNFSHSCYKFIHAKEFSSNNWSMW